jgi:hypothetical protein
MLSLHYAELPVNCRNDALPDERSQTQRLVVTSPLWYNGDVRRYSMSDVALTQLLPLVGFFALWYVLMRFILPRLGVST